MPKRPTLSGLPPFHTSPRLAPHPPLARLATQCLPSHRRSTLAGLTLRCLHAMLLPPTRPASVSFPLVEMMVNPLILAPPAANSPIAGQKGGAALPRSRLRGWDGPAPPRGSGWAQSLPPRLFRPPASRFLSCGRALGLRRRSADLSFLSPAVWTENYLCFDSSVLSSSLTNFRSFKLNIDRVLVL